MSIKESKTPLEELDSVLGEDDDNFENILSELKEKDCIINDIMEYVSKIEQILFGYIQKEEKGYEEVCNEIEELGIIRFFRKSLVDQFNELIDVKNRLIDILRSINFKTK